jgi:hypothetical protein
MIKKNAILFFFTFTIMDDAITKSIVPGAIALSKINQD